MVGVVVVVSAGGLVVEGEGEGGKRREVKMSTCARARSEARVPMRRVRCCEEVGGDAEVVGLEVELVGGASVEVERVVIVGWMVKTDGYEGGRRRYSSRMAWVVRKKKGI